MDDCSCKHCSYSNDEGCSFSSLNCITLFILLLYMRPTTAYLFSFLHLPLISKYYSSLKVYMLCNILE
jgi:hypothetical protein